MKNLFFILLLIISNILLAHNKIDSLENRLSKFTGTDKEKVDLLCELAEAYKGKSPDKIIEYGQHALELSQKLDYNKGEAKSLLNLGIGYNYLSNYDKALKYYKKSLKIEEEIGDKNNIAISLNYIGNVHCKLGNYDKALEYCKRSMKTSQEIGYKNGIAKSLYNIGDIYQSLSNYDKALEYYLKSSKIMEETGYKQGITASLNSIGTVYWYLNDLNKALEYYQKALKINEQTGDKNGVVYSLNNMGIVYHKLGNYDKALEYYQKSLKINEGFGYKNGIAILLNNIGSIYEDSNEYDKALENYLKSLKIFKEIGNKNGIATSLKNIGNNYIKLNNYNKALSYLGQGLKLAKKIELKSLIQDTYESYSDLYFKKADYKKALEYYKLYSEVKDSIFTKESGDKIAEMQTKYETEKKGKEIEILTKDKEIQTLDLSRQKLFRNLFIIGFAFILILVFVIYNRYRLKTKAHTALTKAHNQLNEAKEVIEEKNNHIMSSIRYAQKIQRAILPVDEKMKEALTDYFVIFKPQAIVSGDFYWFSQINDKIFIAVVDCTGHGVPGAFMSMIGNSLLNKIVNENKIFDPAVIMERLHNGVRAALKQEGEDVESQDGMDVCLCVLENKKKKVAFTGAKRPLYHVHNLELVEIKGDRKSIGGLQKEKKRTFTKNEIEVNPGDIIYMATDGFADQSNNKEKKYGSRRLKEYLQKNAKLSLGEQKEALVAELEAHQGNEAQRDDITLLGIKI